MDEESRRRVIDGIENALKMAGATGFEDAGEVIQKVADLLSNRVKPLFNRENLDKVLQEMPHSREETQMAIAIAENLPSLVTFALQALSTQASKTFPMPNTGRPRVLTSEKQRQMCEYIGLLHGQGLDVTVAKTRASQRFDVSMSTVERTWAQRKKGHKPSLNEVIEFLKPKNNSSGGGAAQ